MNFRKYGAIGSFVLGMLVILFGFQNCSDVEFETSDDLTSRTLNFNPSFQDIRPKIRVTMILDNSQSMEAIQDAVQNSISNTLSILEGFSGDITIYTTTQSLDGQQTSVLKGPMVYRVSDGSAYKVLNNSSELSPYTPSDSAYSYWQVEPYKPVSPVLSLTFLRDWQGKSDFATFKIDAAQTINQIGTDGADNEQGLCSLLRSIESNNGSDDFHAYIIATNENDSTSFSTCPREQTKLIENVFTSTPSTEICTPNPDNPMSPNCNISYTIPYQQSQWEKVAYTYTKVSSQKLRYRKTYSAAKSSETAKYIWAGYRKRLRVKLPLTQSSKKQLKITYTSTQYIDSVPHRGTLVNNANYGSEVLASSCQTTDTRVCSAADRSAVDAWSADACNVTCTESLYGPTSTDWTGWQYPSDWVPESPGFSSSSKAECVSLANSEGYKVKGNSLVKDDPTGASLTTSNVFDCQASEETDSDHYQSSYVDLAPYSAGYCSYGTGSSGSNCGSSERSRLDSKHLYASMGIPVDGSGNPKVSLSCNYKCVNGSLDGWTNNNSYNRGSSAALGHICPSDPTNHTGTINANGPHNKWLTYSCADSEKAQARSALGLSASATNFECEYMCNQTTNNTMDNVGYKARTNLANKTSTGGTSCSTSSISAQASAITGANPFNTSLGVLRTCTYYAVDNTARPNCQFTSNVTGLCSESAANLHNGQYLDGDGYLQNFTIKSGSTCTVHDVSEPLKMASCNEGAATMPGSDDSWAESEGNWQVTSFLPGGTDEEIVPFIKQRLEQVHGEKYFVASFINPVDHNQVVEEGLCTWDDINNGNYQHTTRGERYQQLNNLIESTRSGSSAINPACLTDYSGAMAKILQLIVIKANRSYKVDLNLDKNESLDKIFLVDQNDNSTEVTANNFTYESGWITFKETVVLDNIKEIKIVIHVANPFADEEYGRELSE